jgi:hypothetical protein
VMDGERFHGDILAAPLRWCDPWCWPA